MFKGIQDVMQKGADKSFRVSDPSLLSILSAEQLLADDKRQEILNKFPEQLSLSKENFASLCVPLINRFTEFVQQLPSTRHSYYAYEGGMLDHALNRTSIALRLCRSYFHPSGREEAPLTQPQTLWAYALFSAGLLTGLGRVLSDLNVDLFDKEAKLVKHWSPFEGSMLSHGTQYRYDFENIYPDTFRRSATKLLARQLMPKAGFQWLASDTNVLSIWLAILDEDERSAGTLGPILWRADAFALQFYFDEFRQRLEAIHKRDDSSYVTKQTAFSEDALSDEQLDSEAGVDFIKWLKDQIEKDRFEVGKDIPIVEDGLLVPDEVVDAFIKDNAKHKSGKAVLTSLAASGLLRIGAANALSQRFLSLNDNTFIQGAILKNRYLALPASVSANALRTSATLQTKFVKVAGAISLPKVEYFSTNGKLTINAPAIGPKVSPYNPFTSR